MMLKFAKAFHDLLEYGYSLLIVWRHKQKLLVKPLLRVMCTKEWISCDSRRVPV